VVDMIDPMDKLIIPSLQNQTSVETEHMKQMFTMIYSKDDIQLKTDLNLAQIIAITKMNIYGEVFGIKVVPEITKVFMELAVSKNRLGRKEFTEISKAVQSANNEPPGISERLFGARK